MTLIRRAKLKDIDDIVGIHTRSFSSFFLTILGKKFLRLLYSELLNENGNVFFVHISDKNKITGFVVGVTNQTGLYKRLAKKRWFAFAIASSYSAIQNPRIIPRLFRALTYSKNVSKFACPTLLMSLAVSPDEKGKGIGRSLVKEFILEMSNLGISHVCLTTDRDNNQSANLFYQKLGFRIAREFLTPEGRWMNEFVIDTRR